MVWLVGPPGGRVGRTLTRGAVHVVVMLELVAVDEHRQYQGEGGKVRGGCSLGGGSLIPRLGRASRCISLAFPWLRGCRSP